MRKGNDTRKTITVSVRNLVDNVLRCGDLLRLFQGSSRGAFLTGIRAHQKIQKSRPSGYESEVPVSFLYSNKTLDLHIQGRIDGLYHQNGRVVLEEIKTTHRPLDLFLSGQNEHHWGQLKAYAAIYALENNTGSVLAQLTYYHVSTGEIRSFSQDWEIHELKIFFENLIESYLAWLAKIDDWHQTRNNLINTTEFPFLSYRKGQRRMMEDIHETLAGYDQIIIQAPTGIGKTVAALFPAIKALGEGHTQKIFYLTARTTGRVIAEKTLDDLRKKGLRVKSVTLLAREKICFNPEKSCSPDECLYACGFYDRINDALKAFFCLDAFTVETIQKIARKHKVCPHEFSLELSLWADCIICDMNYAFDPRVYLKQFFSDTSSVYTFLIDEAHNLVDRSREMFSATLKKSSFLKLRRELKNKQSAVGRSIGKINSQFLDYRADCEGESDFFSEKSRPEELFPLLVQFTSALERSFIVDPSASRSKEAVELYFDVIHFLRMADQFDDHYTTYYQKKGNDLSVKLFCIDPSKQMREALKRSSSAALFSATLSPLSYFQETLGCQDSTEQRSFPTPFPPENLRVLFSSRISTYYHDRYRTGKILARMIGSFVNSKKGNYFVFFPSFEYLKKIHPLYTQAFPQHKVLTQTAGMTEEDREDFLKKFAGENVQTTVGFVVMGGIFGEAIDLDGDRLSGAVIVGVGLPSPSPEREIIRSHFTELGENGFNYAYVFPGVTRVLQAAGRVIRTEKDRGAILLIDPRYAHPFYQSLLPKEWDVQPVFNDNHPTELLHSFWAKKPGEVTF